MSKHFRADHLIGDLRKGDLFTWQQSTFKALKSFNFYKSIQSYADLDKETRKADNVYLTEQGLIEAISGEPDSVVPLFISENELLISDAVAVPLLDKEVPELKTLLHWLVINKSKDGHEWGAMADVTECFVALAVRWNDVYIHKDEEYTVAETAKKHLEELRSMESGTPDEDELDTLKFKVAVRLIKLSDAARSAHAKAAAALSAAQGKVTLFLGQTNPPGSPLQKLTICTTSGLEKHLGHEIVVFTSFPEHMVSEIVDSLIYQVRVEKKAIADGDELPVPLTGCVRLDGKMPVEVLVKCVHIEPADPATKTYWPAGIPQAAHQYLIKDPKSETEVKDKDYHQLNHSFKPVLKPGK